LSLLFPRSDASEALVIDPHVKVVSFTRFDRSGGGRRAVRASHLKRVTTWILAELGAFIVPDDVDLDAAVSAAAGLRSWHGQIGMNNPSVTSCTRLSTTLPVARLTETASHCRSAHPANRPRSRSVPISDAAQRDSPRLVQPRASTPGQSQPPSGTTRACSTTTPVLN